MTFPLAIWHPSGGTENVRGLLHHMGRDSSRQKQPGPKLSGGAGIRTAQQLFRSHSLGKCFESKLQIQRRHRLGGWWRWEGVLAPVVGGNGDFPHPWKRWWKRQTPSNPLRDSQPHTVQNTHVLLLWSKDFYHLLLRNDVNVILKPVLPRVLLLLGISVYRSAFNTNKRLDVQTAEDF